MVPFPPDPNGKLKSGVIKILDSTSFFISKLNLWIEDEPGYRFWVGNSTTMKPDRGGFMVSICLKIPKYGSKIRKKNTENLILSA